MENSTQHNKNTMEDKDNKEVITLSKEEFEHLKNKTLRIQVRFVKIVDREIIEKLSLSFNDEESARIAAEELAIEQLGLSLDLWDLTRRELTEVYSFYDTEDLFKSTYRILIFPV